MNYTDLVPLAYVTKTPTYNTVIRPTANGYPGSGSFTGPITNAYDGNTATYAQYYLSHGGDGNTCGEFYLDATWTKPCKIFNPYMYLSSYFQMGNYQDKELRYYIYAKISGTWTLIGGTSLVPNSDTWEVRTLTAAGSWDNVTGIRFYLYGFAYSYEGDRNQYVYLRMHEAKCYREKYEEAFRLKKGSGIVAIGSNEVTSSHKLRFKKPTSMVGLPLLDTDDPMASPIRIYNGAAVKSLALAD